MHFYDLAIYVVSHETLNVIIIIIKYNNNMATSSPGRTAAAIRIGRAAAAAVLGPAPALTRAHDDRRYHNRYMVR